MEYIEEAFKMIGKATSIVVGNIAQFFLGPLPRFLLRLGVPYLILLSVTLISSLLFSIFDFTVMIPPLSIGIAMALILALLLVSYIFKKGGKKHEDKRPVDSNQPDEYGVD